MNSVWFQLVKHELLHLLSSLQILQTTRKKTIVMSMLYGLVAALGMVYSGGTAYGLWMLGASESIMPILLAAMLFIVLISTLMKAGHQLYDASDLEMLMSMPISLKMILYSKLSGSFLLNCLVSFVILIPSALVLSVLDGAWIVLLMSVVCVPFIVLIPMSLGVLFSAGVTMISSRCKAGVLVSVILLCALVLCLPSLIHGVSTMQIVQLSEQMAGVLRINPLVSLMKGALYGELVEIVLLVLLSLLMSAAVMAFIHKNYLKMHSAVHASAKKSYQLKMQKSKSLMKALIVREFRHYFSSSLAVSNTLIGLVLATVLAVSVCFVSLEEAALLLGVSLDAKWLKLMLPVIFAMMCSMCSTTSFSLSLEGKSLWLIQMLPVHFLDVLRSKIGMNLLLNLPAALAGSIILILNFQPNPVHSVFTLLYPVVLIGFSAVNGMLANVCFQNYSWSSEAQIIKQSFPVLLGILVPVGIGSLSMAGILVIQKDAFLLVLCAAIVLLSVLEWELMKRKSIEG